MPRLIAIFAAIVAAAAAAYWTLPRNGFVDYDDMAHIVADPVVTAPLSATSIRKAFALGHDVAYWQPLAVLSLAVDHSLFGLDPAAFHLGNLVLHLATALVLLLLLFRTTGNAWRSGFAAALFAVHPVAVEAVAWAVERRAVLAGFLGFLGVFWFCEWVRRGGAWRYALSLALVSLSLLAKGLFLPSAALLLALCFWPLLRKDPRRSVLEVLPFGAVSLAVAATVLHTIGPDRPGEPALGLRLANAVVLPFRHLAHLAWPLDLGVYYPYPEQVPAWQVAGGLAGLAVISFAAWRYRKDAPYLLAGWAWFLAALIPTLGLKQQGQWAALADRHAYVAAFGVFVAVTWGVADLGRRWSRFAAPAVGVGALMALVLVTHRQVGTWRDTVTLFGRADAVADRPDVHVKYGLGKALADAGRFAEAEPVLLQAVTLGPGHVEAWFSLGRVFLLDGRRRDVLAAEALGRAVQLDPRHLAARSTLGAALNRLGRHEETIALLGAGPFLPEGRLNLGVAYVAVGRTDLAEEQARALGASPLGQTLRDYIARSGGAGR